MNVVTRVARAQKFAGRVEYVAEKGMMTLVAKMAVLEGIPPTFVYIDKVRKS